MIPDHLIDKAARAMHANGPGGGETEEYEDTPPWYQVVAERRARHALEAVAADIWQEGVNFALPGKETWAEAAHNPYRAPEAA